MILLFLIIPFLMLVSKEELFGAWESSPTCNYMVLVKYMTDKNTSNMLELYSNLKSHDSSCKIYSNEKTYSLLKLPTNVQVFY